MRSLRALLVVVVALVAGAARAQVAIATSITEHDAAQRHIAAAIVGAATRTWDVVRPPLAAADVASCRPGDTDCLRELAAGRGATHLLVIGVGPLGVREHVVAVQLFDVSTKTPLFEESVVQRPDSGGTASGLGEVTQMVRNLTRVAGPPPPRSVVAPPIVEENSRLLTWIGLSAMIGGTVVGLGGGAVGAITASEDRDYAAIDDSLWAGSLVSAGFVAVGAALVVVDQF